MLSKFLKRYHQVPDDLPRKVVRENEFEVHPHDESNWLISYADLMTLLCGFFILMFSLSKLDQPEFEKVKEVLAKQFGGNYEAPTENMKAFFTQSLADLGLKNQAIIKADGFGVSVIFQSALLFDTLSADILPEGIKALNGLSEKIREKETQDRKHFRIVVEGHTDSRPIKNDAYPSNWELSSARSARVVRQFLTKGFDPQQLVAVGYGETRPEMKDRTESGLWIEEGLQKNRRVVVRIMLPTVDVIPFTDPGYRLPAAIPNSESTQPSKQ